MPLGQRDPSYRHALRKSELSEPCILTTRVPSSLLKLLVSMMQIGRISKYWPRPLVGLSKRELSLGVHGQDPYHRTATRSWYPYRSSYACIEFQPTEWPALPSRTSRCLPVCVGRKRCLTSSSLLPCGEKSCQLLGNGGKTNCIRPFGRK